MFNNRVKWRAKNVDARGTHSETLEFFASFRPNRQRFAPETVGRAAVGETCDLPRSACCSNCSARPISRSSTFSAKRVLLKKKKKLGVTLGVSFLVVSRWRAKTVYYLVVRARGVYGDIARVMRRSDGTQILLHVVGQRQLHGTDYRRIASAHHGFVHVLKSYREYRRSDG